MSSALGAPALASEAAFGAPLRVPARDFNRGTLPEGTQAEFLGILKGHSCSARDPKAELLTAQAGAPATAAATSEATTAATPTPPQFTSQPAPVGGIGNLIPPTPVPTGPIVTPPPIPTPSPAPTVSLGPVYLLRSTGTPPPMVPKGTTPAPGATATPSPTPAPTGVPTLGPGQYAVLSDTLIGSTNPGIPGDAIGNVHVYYDEGVIVGERAHYNGDRTITLTGNPYIINRAKDSVLYADSIVFDTVSQHATLLNGHGATTEGVDQGELYYTAQKLTSTRKVVHGDHTSFTTCLNPHSGYHIQARTFDMTPGERLIARGAVVFLGPLAIFYLPFVIIPLHKNNPLLARQAPILPLVGYSQSEGYWIKTRLPFGSTPTYYGDYRVEYFTKRGLGLGYDGNISRRDFKRITQIQSYTISDRTTNSRNSNVSLNDTEMFSPNTRMGLNGSYNSNFGPNVFQPPQFNVSGNVSTNGLRSSENFSFNRYTFGSLNDQTTLSLTQSLLLSPTLNQTFNINYSKTATGSSGAPSVTDNTLQLASQTSYRTTAADYLFSVKKTDATQVQQVGYDIVPELQILPHINFHDFRFPFQTQFTYGYYTEPQRNFSTERSEILFNWPLNFNVFRTSLFTAGLNVRQDLYGTGDAKATVQQNAQLTTPIGTHIVNSMSYNDSYPIGPPDVPFQLLDRIAGAYKQGQDTLQIFNRDVFLLTLSSGTAFNRQAQAVPYQFMLRPSLRSFLTLGGSWVPGAGNGFFTTNAQMMTGLGKNADLEFTTNIDWKTKGRLLNKNVYYRVIVDDCYQIVASFNQDSKQFNIGFNLLAFPTRGVGFGIGGQHNGSIIPGIEQLITTNYPSFGQ